MENVSQKMLLAVVRSENGDLFRGISESPHVHEGGNNKLGFRQVLVEMRIGLRFANAIEILDVDHLQRMNNKSQYWL